MTKRAGSNVQLRRLSKRAPLPEPELPATPAPPRASAETESEFSFRVDPTPRRSASVQIDPAPPAETGAMRTRAARRALAPEAAPGNALAETSAETFHGAPPAAEGATVSVSDFGEILARRWRTIAATTALLTALGTTLAFVISPKYTASTSIFIDPRARPAFQTDIAAPGGVYDPNMVDSQVILMESETVLRRVVAAERLAQDPDFAGTKGDPVANAVVNLKEVMKVKRPERTYVVEIAVRTKAAEKSARLANAIAKAYLSDGSDTKTDTVSREQGWLDRHLNELEKRLRAAEAKVDEYRSKNRIYGTEGRLVSEQQLSEINRALSDSQRKAAEAKATLDQVEMLRRSGKLPDATNEALKSGVIERLRTQQAEILRLEANSRSTLGPRHPASIEVREQLLEVQRQIREELARIAENGRSSYAVARANVQGLERELERLKTNSSETNHTLLGLRELERAVEAQKTVYEKFLRDKEAIARLSVETPAGRVIQLAEVPNKPSFPNRPLFIVLSAVAGLFMGVGLALLMETLTRGRAGSHSGAPQGARGAGASTASLFARSGPVSARLPAPARRALMGFGRKPDAISAVLNAPEGAYMRAAAALAARLWSDADTAPASVMVSGAEKDAAHPALALALALALARQGQGVLLVDGHGGEGSLTQRLSPGATPVEIMVGGRRQSALSLPAGLSGSICLLPFGGQGANGAPVKRVAPADITLIDGPGLRTPAFARLDLGRAIEGVLAVLPPGKSKPGRALRKDIEARTGAALVGLVAQDG
jgi:polysaccharide biosynthesis transport protein